MSRYGFASLTVASLLLVGAPAHAVLLSLDHAVFGLGSITLDTDTGFKWLDVSLSRGRTFVDVASQFGPGGDFEGFRHAEVSQVRALWVAAGIPDIDRSSVSNIGPATSLIALVGATTSQGGPGTLGFTNTPGSLDAGLRINADLGFEFLNGIPVYGARFGTSRSTTVPFGEVGHWLIATPEPVSLVLMGIGLAGIGIARRRATISRSKAPARRGAVVGIPANLTHKN